MRKLLFKGLGILIFAIIFYIVYTVATTKNHSPQDTATYTEDGFNIEVIYCRPYKKDRVIFGSEDEEALQPYGTYWRTGANDATEITFKNDVKVAGKDLKAGRYRFYTVPGKEQWTIAFNTELGQWGYMEPNYDLDVLKATVPVNYRDTPLEQFTILLQNDGADKAKMILSWDTSEVVIPIEK
ncbi:DUF2911 domain-containing protein [Flexithrix dorotheae]|uniref:DUF2911 domain-containing protein n=1 Tax=Flexithrix dorotheae TaxID=70993 RepID=UPI00035EBE11|nr:DUF2911 domain-containing protein [Flexithrix dorotheae]